MAPLPAGPRQGGSSERPCRQTGGERREAGRPSRATLGPTVLEGRELKVRAGRDRGALANNQALLGPQAAPPPPEGLKPHEGERTGNRPARTRAETSHEPAQSLAGLGRSTLTLTDGEKPGQNTSIQGFFRCHFNIHSSTENYQDLHEEEETVQPHQRILGSRLRL